MWKATRYGGLILGLLWPGVAITASHLAAPYPTRPVRGGSFDPSGPKLRKYSETDRMPSLFGAEEDTYDRYAACLAATEGLRRLRDRDITDELQGLRDPEQAAQKRRQIAAQYVQNSGRVLRALGMSVSQFNALGKEISQDPKLKEKIIEQAYLYRMAAAIHLDRSPLPEKAPGTGDGSGDHLSNYQRDKVRLFCESMNEIEKLRTGQVERLKRALQADDFPTNINISDPSLLPFLHPKAKAVVQAFPLQAEAIVRKHGLNSEEFNHMLHASQANPIFRWKVQKHLKIPSSSSSSPSSPNPPPPAASPPSAAGSPAPPSGAAPPRIMSQQRPSEEGGNPSFRPPSTPVPSYK